MTFLLVCVCGGLGAVCRFMLNTSIQRWWNRYFPIASLLVNCLACLFAGIAIQSYLALNVQHSTYWLFAAGFLAGLSTFSTVVNEALSMLHGKHAMAAIVYAVISLAFPLVCIMLGWWLGSLMV